VGSEEEKLHLAWQVAATDPCPGATCPPAQYFPFTGVKTLLKDTRATLNIAPERRVAIALAGVATLATAVVVFAPGVHFAYRSPAGHAALETAAALIGFLTAYLLFARFRLGGVGSDLWLASALAVLAASTLCFAVLPAIAGRAPGSLLSWTRVFSDTVGFLAFAAAAWAPMRALRRPRDAERWALALTAGTLVVCFALALLLSGALPTPIDPTLSPEDSMRPRIVGATLVEVAQLIAVAALLVAGIGFARRSGRQRDGFFSWLATATMFGVLGRVHYFLFPSLYSPWVHTGDFMRLAYYLLILGAALHEISGYQPRLAQAAILDERRRIARDLHDGLAQELAFVASGLRSFEDEPPTRAEIAQMIEAADQALLESRQAISALTANPDEPLSEAVSRMASALALRAGTALSLAVDEGVDATQPVRDAVLGITREAMTNALRHAGGRQVEVTLSCNGAVRLSVRDDGIGFAPLDDGLGDGHLGLDSMRERAEAVGGRLTVRSARGRGTLVQAVLPR
jgi:signal transduction histidine kinase